MGRVVWHGLMTTAAEGSLASYGLQRAARTRFELRCDVAVHRHRQLFW